MGLFRKWKIKKKKLKLIVYGVCASYGPHNGTGQGGCYSGLLTRTRMSAVRTRRQEQEQVSHLLQFPLNGLCKLLQVIQGPLIQWHMKNIK